MYAQNYPIRDSNNGVTVYTDNGAIVKTSNSNDYACHCEFTYKVQYTKDGQTVEDTVKYTFDIDPKGERTLFQTPATVTSITGTRAEKIE
jgi:hypothetical protein